MGIMSKKLLAVAAAGTLLLAAAPTVSYADNNQAIPQGVGSAVLANADYFGGVDPSTVVTVDIVLKVQNKDALAQYIKDTTTPGSSHYRQYLSPTNFKAQYAPQPAQITAITNYLSSFGISSTVFANNLIITATGTAGAFDQAFSVDIQNAKYKGKSFHASKTDPVAPASIANNILAILGLTDYSNLATHTVKQVADDASQPNVTPAPTGRMTNDLVSRYNVQPLYNKGANGSGQTIGIVTLADFNPTDAYSYWAYNNIPVSPNRITKINVDGGSGLSEWDGSDETALDVEQSGALAPGANINVYVAPNTDTGFVDGFAKAINDNVAKQISCSWGESETIIDAFVQYQMETPQYAEVFNQLFMQAAAQGISMFSAAGDAGAYDASADIGTFNLSVDNPADSPYITAAGGTTVPFTRDYPQYNLTVSVSKERAWGWDYLYPLFNARHLDNPSGYAYYYFVGGGGGFSDLFATPDYQQGVPGVNSYTGVSQWDISSDYSKVQPAKTATVVTGTGTGRNVPDLSMNADPYTGYAVYFNLPVDDNPADGTDSGWATYGGTSFVAPQFAGLSALINSANGTDVGFWNPQLYRYATSANSPLHPLNDTGTSNDNIFYTGTPGTVYNQATGLGTPDVSALANSFGK